MKIVKNVIYTILMITVALVIFTTTTKATTVKVTADTLNLRKEAKITADIVTLLSKGDKCELLEEAGDWYKVKYKTYTGYVSKEYVEKEKEESSTQTNQTNNTTVNENSVNNNTIAENNGGNTTNNNTTTNNNEQNNNENNAGNNEPTQNESNTPTNVIVKAKIAKDTNIKVIPLINSSNLDTVKKDAEITILTELANWSYIQTDELAGWVRNDSITGKVSDTLKNDSSENNKQDDENKDNNQDNNQTDKKDEEDETTATFTKKDMYVNDEYVNLRKEPSTSSDIIMVVVLNTKLTVIGESGSWYKVSTSSGDAYVSKSLLSNEKKTTTSRSNVDRTVESDDPGAVQMSYVDDKKSTTNTTVSETTSSTTKTNQTTTSTVSTSSNSTKGAEIVSYAKQFLGVPYVYGGASKSGFDCSGFTMYVYKHFGISMRHGAQAQAKLGKAVNANKNSASSLKENLQPGDLVFFLDYETMDEIGHCGIYIGNGNFIHASSGSGYCVKINSLLPGEYYNTRYCAARRII